MLLTDMKENIRKKLELEKEDLKGKRDMALTVFLITSLLSIYASFHGLQTCYEQGKAIADVTPLIKDNIDKQGKLIDEYNANSEESRRQAQLKLNWSNSYLNKSQENLANASSLVKEQQNIITSMAKSVDRSISYTIYKTYSEAFGGDPKIWALIIGIFLALLTENSFWFSTAENVRLNSKKDIKLYDNNNDFANRVIDAIIFDDKKNENKSIGIRFEDENETPEMKHPIGFKVGETFHEDETVKQKTVPKSVSPKPKSVPIKFEIIEDETPDLKQKNVNGNVSIGGKRFNLSDIDNETMKHFQDRFMFQYEYKSEPLIVDVCNNWNTFSEAKRSTRNVSKIVSEIMPGTKRSVSPTTCYRVMKKNSLI